MNNNLNCKNTHRKNFCYVNNHSSNVTLFIPDWEYMTNPKKQHLLNTTVPNDAIYSKYICIHCSTRKRPVAKKDSTNEHYRCTKRCCPLPYHWTLCETCIQIQHFPIKANDAKRKRDAELFQKTFSRLPEDVQNLIRDYIPTAFAFTRISSRLFLEKTLKNGSRKLERCLINQSDRVLENVHGTLRSIDFSEHLSRMSKKNKNDHIKKKTIELYESLSDTYRSTLICDEDFWRLRVKEGVRQFIKRGEMMEHVQKLLCPTDIRKYLLPTSHSFNLTT